MKKTFLYPLLFTVILLVESCSKFLDVNPSTQSVNPSTIKDFQEMLNIDSLGTGYYFLADLMSDDVNMSNANLALASNIYMRTFRWSDTIWYPSDQDFIYNSSYTRILQMNVLLSKVNSAPADSSNTPAAKSTVISQALINRAWYYLQLANIYGPAYNASTAATDLTVPLILTPQSGTLPARATAQSMYRQIISDLRAAVNNSYLPALGVNIIHPGKAAGFALLARTYLYEANYDSAQIFADSALNIYNTVLDYNSSAVAPTQLYDLVSNPEILVAHISTDLGYYAAYNATFQISSALSDTLGTTDIRKAKYFVQASRFSPFTYKASSTSVVMDNSVSVPEVLLTKAECLARKGDVTGASTIVEQLRKKRIYTSSYAARTSYNSGNILAFVLGERRRELFCHGGLRLFDLKRFNKEAALQRTIYRLTDSNVRRDSLVVNSPKYLLPFAATIIANNPNILQNPRH